MKKKLGLLFLIAVIASAGIGVSYAYSSDDFHVKSKLSCDCYYNPNIGIKGIDTGDPGPNYMSSGGSLYPLFSPEDGTADPNHEPGKNDEGKNVASTNLKNCGYKCHIWNDGKCIPLYKNLYVWICNSYPWYASSISFEFGNCGKTPGCIKKIYMENCGDTDLIDFIKIDEWILTKEEIVINSGFGEVNLCSALKNLVLYPKDLINVYISFHFEQDVDGKVMPQNAFVYFKYVIVWEQCPFVPSPCNECMGKVTQLTLRYDGDAESQIIVKQKKPNEIVFDDYVEPGEEFTFNGVDKKGTLSTEIKIYVNNVLNTKIHTSCSEPIGPGMVFGTFTVIEGYSREGGLLCPP